MLSSIVHTCPDSETVLRNTTSCDTPNETLEIWSSLNKSMLTKQHKNLSLLNVKIKNGT